ncbi:cupin domain-containing protein [Nitriliruptor alkaliphilus]|uniref:cupin domain-containing protein n=1 Tax=Nitriliruptor alkaliphilus TaxID=427918 RepID=UPI001B802763|nr:cupin domain-containing protein [Nitriliruptor alkaliphilus]
MRIDWHAIPGGPGMRQGSSRRAIAAERLSAVRVETTPDAVFDGKLHRHDNEQLLVMIDGSVHLQIDDEDLWVKAGDLVVFPPGSWHGAIGVGPDGAEYYEIFSPPRLDQLPGWVGPSALEFDRS